MALHNNKDGHCSYSTVDRFEKFISCQADVVEDIGSDADDEYKSMETASDSYTIDHIELDCGKVLKQVQVAYRTFGTLNEAGDNCLVVCHALTGNADLDSWWGFLLGKGKVFDDSRMFVVCLNILGSCYGTCGPTSINPDTGKVYGVDFPYVTVRDSVRLHMKVVKEYLGVRKVACVVGGSLGGMQALEWAILGGEKFVGAVITMCCGALHHPWQTSFSEAQRQAIYSDPAWSSGRYLNKGSTPPFQGLAIARSIAMITYRCHAGYGEKFGRLAADTDSTTNGVDQFSGNNFAVKNYLRYQGQKFCKRFDALSYVILTQMMDAHDVGKGRNGGTEGVLSSMTQPVLVVSVNSDILYPFGDQAYLLKHIPKSTLFTVDSMHGHDAFLLEHDQIGQGAIKFMKKFVYKQDTSRND